MNVQTVSSQFLVSRRLGAIVDPWPLVSQALQGALAVSQLGHGSKEQAARFGNSGTIVRPLFDATADLIQSTDRVSRLLERQGGDLLERQFIAGACLAELDSQDLREFGSLMSALSTKASSASSWAIMLAQHCDPIARLIATDVEPLGSVSARLARVYSGAVSNRRGLNEALEILGAYYDALRRCLEREAN